MLSEILDKARGHYRAGRLPRAERACRQVLEQDGDHLPAWFLLGLVTYQAGRDADAIAAFREAIRRRPNYPDAHNNIGICLARQGKLAEAAESFRAAIEHRPEYPEARNNLGNTLRDQGKLDEAIEHYRAAIQGSPEYADAINNLGIAQSRKGDWTEAEASYRESIRLRANHPEARNNLGTALAALKRFDEALAAFEEALQLKPAYADAHANLGLALAELERWPEAVAAFRQAVQLAPRGAQRYVHLGRALAANGDLEEAAAAFRQAVSVDDKLIEPHRRLATLLEEMGDLAGAADALETVVKLEPNSAALHNRLAALLLAEQKFPGASKHLERALKLKPDFAEAHVNRAHYRLITGDFEKGWADLAWRWKQPAGGLPRFERPRWSGEETAGRRLLLCCDLEAADTLQFVRFARQLKQGGATVLVQTAEPLAGILGNCPYIDEVFAGESAPAEFDFFETFLGLPGGFNTTLANLAPDEQYLFADPSRVTFWRDELAYLRAFRIGILWQGELSDRRAIPLAHFAPLAALPNVHLVSLEQNSGREQLRDAPFAVTDLGGRIDEAKSAYQDLAAVMQNLDLVVTADGALAHLAGGLGVPVWVALPHAADWRWLLQREDSPWYRTMRLFRQQEPGDWAPVFERMATTLRQKLAAIGDGEPSTLGPPASSAAALNAAGVRLAEKGRLDDANSMFRQALAIDPNLAEGHNNLGNALQNQGNFDDAVLHLREAIRLRARYPEAHNNLGIALCKLRELESAKASFLQAIEQRPGFAQAYNNLGMALAEQRQMEEAETHFRQAIELDPDLASAHGNLGHALADQGKFEEAKACLETAVRLAEKNSDYHNSLGNVLRELKKLDESARCFERAIELRPPYADAHNNLGITRARQGKLDDAVKHYQEAIRLRPNFAGAHNNLGIALAQQEKRAEAMASYRQAIRIKPDYAEAHNNLAIALTQAASFDEALVMYRKALELKKNYPEAHSNLGIALTEFGDFDAALDEFAQALALREDYPDARMNRALTHLLIGNFTEGWNDYEWRWQCKDFQPRSFKQPRWNGEELNGKRILLHTEQGLGDTFQFIRYAALVKQRGGYVLVQAPRPLLRILAHCPAIDGVILEGGELPAFDVQIPLLSLPGVFGTRLDSVPTAEPYLRADEDLVNRWRKELAHIDAFKVGINWQGNPKYRGDRRRSVPLAHFAPLARIEGVRLISLQRNYGTEQIKQARFFITEIGGQIDEASGAFMDTAAILMNLDLLVTSDTALAHLAGALGASVWLALPRAPDWRWLLDRSDSPWYPTMRLFRQPEFDNWEPVFEKMAHELEKTLARGRRRTPFRMELGLGDALDRLCRLRVQERFARAPSAPRELDRLEEHFAQVTRQDDILPAVTELEAIHESLRELQTQADSIVSFEQRDPMSIELAIALTELERRRRALIQQLNCLDSV